MRKILLFSIVLSLTLILLACSSGSTEENFPSDDIKFIVHTSSGGPTDLMAREVAKAVEEVTEVNVTVENKPGGSGATAMSEVYSSEADGYTLGAMTPSQIGLLNGTLKDQYSLDDYTWMSRSQIDPYVLVTQTNSPYESIEDVINQLQEEPNSINVGGYGGTGSAHNISWNIFADAANIDANWTPYESTGDAVTALLGGHIDVANSNPGQVSQYVESGELQILAVNAEERLDEFPDVPTLIELGYEVDTDWVQFRGFFGPKDIPAEVIAEWDSIFEKAYQTESYQKYMENAQMVEGPLMQEEFNDYINRQDELTSEWYDRLEIN